MVPPNKKVRGPRPPPPVPTPKVLSEKMWLFRGGVKTYSGLSYIFSGVRTPNPQDLRPWNGIAKQQKVMEKNKQGPVFPH